MTEKSRAISISSCFSYEIPILEQIPLVARAGFTHLSIGGQYEHSGILDQGRLSALADALSTYSIGIDSVHGTNLNRANSIADLEPIVEAAHTLQAPVVVVHCSSFTFSPSRYEDERHNVLRNIPQLEQLGKQYAVRFALENVLPGVATQLVEHVLSECAPQVIGFCYDSSHDQIGGPRPFTLLEEHKNRLIATHLSDRIGEFTDHVLPGEGFIDFRELTRILKTSHYCAPLLLEVMMTHSQFKDPIEFLAQAYRRAVEIYDEVFA